MAMMDRLSVAAAHVAVAESPHHHGDHCAETEEAATVASTTPNTATAPVAPATQPHHYHHYYYHHRHRRQPLLVAVITVCLRCSNHCCRHYFDTLVYTSINQHNWHNQPPSLTSPSLSPLTRRLLEWSSS